MHARAVCLAFQIAQRCASATHRDQGKDRESKISVAFAPGSHEPQTRPRYPAPSDTNRTDGSSLSRERPSTVRGGARAHRQIDSLMLIVSGNGGQPDLMDFIFHS